MSIARRVKNTCTRRRAARGRLLRKGAAQAGTGRGPEREYGQRRPRHATHSEKSRMHLSMERPMEKAVPRTARRRASASNKTNTAAKKPEVRQPKRKGKSGERQRRFVMLGDNIESPLSGQRIRAPGARQHREEGPRGSSQRRGKRGEIQHEIS